MKLESLEQSHGPVVAEIRDRVQLRDPPAASGGSDHAASCFGGVTVTRMLRQQREPKVWTDKKIALDETTNSQRRAISFSLYQVHAVSEDAIRTPDSVPDVAHRVGGRADSAIADVLKERWIIEKSIKERRIG